MSPRIRTATFVEELAAASLTGLPFTWGEEEGELSFDPSMTPAQISAVQAVLAAHDPDAVPPEPLQGSDFAAAIFLGLAGASAEAKLERGLILLGKSWRVGVFINMLDVTTPSATRGLVLRSQWAAIKADPAIGVGGSDPAALTAGECAAIEALGLTFGIALAG